MIDAINLHSHILIPTVSYLSSKCNVFDINFRTDFT